MLQSQAEAKRIRERLLKPASGVQSEELEVVSSVKHARRQAGIRQQQSAAMRAVLAEQRRQALIAAMEQAILRRIEAEEQRKQLPPEEVEQLGGGQIPLKLEEIIRAVRNHFNLTLAQLLSVRRSLDVVRPRQIIMYLARRHTVLSLPQIGKRLGRIDHTTCLHGSRRIAELRDTNSKISAALEAIEMTLGVCDRR